MVAHTELVAQAPPEKILNYKHPTTCNGKSFIPNGRGYIGNGQTLQNGSAGEFKPSKKKMVHTVEECTLFVAFCTFVSYGVLLLVGYIKEFFWPPSSMEKNREGYVPLYVGFESFYTRNVYRRIQDCWARPISSVPGAEIDLMERDTPDYGWTMNLTGKIIKCINVGSYNYLGYAENKGACHDAAAETTKNVGVTTGSPRNEMGSLAIQEELETLVAEFLGVDDALTFGMGFATNVLNIPSLLGPGCLVLSDEFNHASLILGIKLSGATVKVFHHNDSVDLERKLREALVYGQNRTRRPYKMAIIVVEGIYSMEGSIVDLPAIIAIKKKYKAYLYVDEAHSIGALGPNGGGVVDYHKCNPKDVDILMGTFTKSFGAAGGYIAGSKDLIAHLRINSDAQNYAASMAAPVAQQIITSLQQIMGKDGSDEGQRRIQQLARNARYFHKRLSQMGFIVYGDGNSPVIPLLLYMVPKITLFVRELTKRGVAGVGVGFPATKITGGRMRFCLSAAHTKEHLDKILTEVEEVGYITGAYYSRRKMDMTPVEW